jgi:hypothetical protein
VNDHSCMLIADIFPMCEIHGFVMWLWSGVFVCVCVCVCVSSVTVIRVSYILGILADDSGLHAYIDISVLK